MDKQLCKRSPEAEVRIIQHRDGNRPSIIPLLTRYYIWLQAAAIRDIQRRRKGEHRYRKYRRLEIWTA
ncbi:MAG: hypothetical protein WBZ36_20630 [Candidatus Nitrosopolaris sp.]